MDTALLVARLALAVVFVTAGGTKLASPAGSRQAVLDFGLPASLAPTVARLLPLGELMAGGMLLVAASARVGAVLALLLLAAFGAAILANLTKGRTPDCHCFGQVHSDPVGPSTLVRNAGLGVVAGFVAWGGPGSGFAEAGAWLSRHGAMVVSVCTLVLVVIQGRIIVRLLRQQGRLLLRLEAVEASVAPEPDGLALGTRAPSFALSALTGERRALAGLLTRGHPVALVFISPSCMPCQALWPDLTRWQTELGDRITVVAITDRRPPDEGSAPPVGPLLVLLDEDDAVARSYRVGATPSAVLVGTDGIVSAPLAEGAAGVRHLVEEAARSGPSPDVASQLPVHDHNGDSPVLLEGPHGRAR